MTGLCRTTDSVAMYSIARISARPPQQLRLPVRLPESLLMAPQRATCGAMPTRAAICLPGMEPSSGSSANSVRRVTAPTPLTDCNSSSRSCHSGVWVTRCCICSSIALISVSSQSNHPEAGGLCCWMRARNSGRLCCIRLDSATRPQIPFYVT